MHVSCMYIYFIKTLPYYVCLDGCKYTGDIFLVILIRAESRLLQSYFELKSNKLNLSVSVLCLGMLLTPIIQKHLSIKFNSGYFR